MVLDRGVDAQHQIGGWTHAQGNLALRQHLDQGRILYRPHAVVDPVGTQAIQRIPNAFRPTGLARMHRSAQAGIGGAPKGVGKARAGASRAGFVAIHRQSHHPRVAQRAQAIHQLGRGIGRLGAQQTDTQTNRWQAVLFGFLATGIHGVQHRLKPAVPGMPVGGIENDIGIAGAVVGQSLADTVTEFRQPCRRAGQAAGQIEKVQKIRQPGELKQLGLRSGQGNTLQPGPIGNLRSLEAALQVKMHLGLG